MPREIVPIGTDMAHRRGLTGPSIRDSLMPRPPCPVCNHPTGDCVGEHPDVVNTDMPVDDPMVVVEHDAFITVPSPGAVERSMTFRGFTAGHSYRRSKVENAMEVHGIRVLYHEVPTIPVETK